MGGSAWKKREMVDTWISGLRMELPFARETMRLMAQLIESRGREVKMYLDLGAGDGVVAELMLRSFPESHAVLVDFSDAMIEEAGKRLAGYGDRVKLIAADLSNSAWVSAIPNDRKYDAALSAYCIHHLEHDRKRELYSEVFELLGPDGIFMNLDCVTVCEGSTKQLFEQRAVDEILKFEEQRENGKSREEVEQFWQRDDDQDKPSPLDDQVHWLDEIGYEDVDIYFKWLEIVLFGGVKPSQSREALQ